MAACILNGKKIVLFERAFSSWPCRKKKETFVYKKFQSLLDLGSIDYTIQIVGNVALERLLYDIAERITPRLKELNLKVIKKIVQCNQ